MPKEEKTVDIDASGPDTEVEIKEEKTHGELDKELKIEVNDETTQDSDKPADTPKKLDESVDVRDRKDDKEPVQEEKKELEEYGEGVKKRIAKLTKKWREAERQKEAAIDYARGGQIELNQLKTRFSKLEPSYVTALENRVTSGLDAAKAKLAAAREASDINAEVDAQKEIAKLGVEEARLVALKERQAQDKDKIIKTPSLEQTLQQTPAADPKAEAWAEKNEWF